MQENRSQLNVGAILAVGAAFDTQAGLRRRAPKWMQKIALEWFYRLLMEPRRLWRRYLIGNTQFVLLVMRQWAGTKIERLWRFIRRHVAAKAGNFPAAGATHEED
jgi:N-acetylglucosaminyldiphosphoundecaprenol N-acetyl-beta-D-mannosaminyltransferase